MKRIVTRRKLSTIAFGMTALYLLNTLATAQVSAYRRSDFVDSLVYRRYADGHIWEISLAPGSNWQQHDLFLSCGPSRGRVAAAANPMGYIRNDGVNDGINAVVYAGTDHNIWELSLQSGNWCPTNLSTSSGSSAPPADPSASPWGYVTAALASGVVYRGSDQRIYQLTRINGVWQSADLFHWTPNSVAPSADPVAYVNGQGHDGVIYIGMDQHVHQFEWIEAGEDSQWLHTDLTASAVAPAAALYTKPTGFVGEQATSEVAYSGADGHIYVLFFSADDPHWFYTDGNPTAPTGSLANSSPVSYRRSDGWYSVVYGGQNHDIWEVYSWDGIHWGLGDVTYTAGGAGWVGPGGPAAYVRWDNYNSIVYTEAFSFYFDELTLYPAGPWQAWQLPYTH